MATKEGRSQIWYSDGNGIVEGYTETVDDIIETIIGTYNEHFGTDINIWTPETKTLQVGDTVPNWNAYEKIELPEPQGQKIAVKMDIRYIAGTLLNGLYLCLATNSNSWAGISNDGVVAGTYPKVSDVVIDLKSKLSAAGYTNVNVQMNETFVASGDVLSDWSDYEKIG